MILFFDQEVLLGGDTTKGQVGKTGSQDAGEIVSWIKRRIIHGSKVVILGDVGPDEADDDDLEASSLPHHMFIDLAKHSSDKVELLRHAAQIFDKDLSDGVYFMGSGTQLPLDSTHELKCVVCAWTNPSRSMSETPSGHTTIKSLNELSEVHEYDFNDILDSQQKYNSDTLMNLPGREFWVDTSKDEKVHVRSIGSYFATRYLRDSVPPILRTWRKAIWDFKDGKSTKVISDAIGDHFKHFAAAQKLGPGEITLIPIPASTQAKSTERYSRFMEFVSSKTGLKNGMGLIYREVDRQPSHVTGLRKTSADGVGMRSEKLDGLNVILFDDVVTTGSTLKGVVSALKEKKCNVLEVWCLAATTTPEQEVARLTADRREFEWKEEVVLTTMVQESQVSYGRIVKEVVTYREPLKSTNPYRLSNVAEEMNVSISDVVIFLETRGIKVKGKPNTKLRPSHYDMVRMRFRGFEVSN